MYLRGGRAGDLHCGPSYPLTSVPQGSPIRIPGNQVVGTGLARRRDSGTPRRAWSVMNGQKLR